MAVSTWFATIGQFLMKHREIEIPKRESRPPRAARKRKTINRKRRQ